MNVYTKVGGKFEKTKFNFTDGYNWDNFFYEYWIFRIK